MYLIQATHKKLKEISKSFGYNFTMVVDFLFYVFDTYSYEEKKNMLKFCNITKEGDKRKDKNKNEEDSPSFHIELNKLLEERLNNLCKECEQLISPSDAIDFLIFVLQNVPQEILEDLIIQYSLESQDFQIEESHLGDKNLSDSGSPIHIEPDFPSDSENYIKITPLAHS